MEKTEYKNRPKEFCQKIIDVCINAINELTRISVTYNREKDSSGWKTTFVVKDKMQKIEIKNKPVPQLDEKSQRLVVKLENINMRQDMIKKIVEEYQPQTWKWFDANREALKENAFKSPSGLLLVHLGLVESKKKK
jgi:plasmid replication initiation protein